MWVENEVGRRIGGYPRRRILCPSRAGRCSVPRATRGGRLRESWGRCGLRAGKGMWTASLSSLPWALAVFVVVVVVAVAALGVVVVGSLSLLSLLSSSSSASSLVAGRCVDARQTARRSLPRLSDIRPPSPPSLRPSIWRVARPRSTRVKRGRGGFASSKWPATSEGSRADEGLPGDLCHRCPSACVGVCPCAVFPCAGVSVRSLSICVLVRARA